MESNQELNIVVTLIVGIIVMLILAVVIVIFVIKYQTNILNQREIMRETEKRFQIDLLDASIIASDKEREAVAKNMHDDLGALTNIIKINNGRLTNNLKNDEIILEIIKLNNKLLLDINDNIRAISNDLSSQTLNQFGFLKALEEICSQISGSVDVNLHSNDLTVRFNKNTEIQLFRISKEILTNILKHSNPSEINLTLNIADNLLTIFFIHNGSGINDDDIGKILINNNGLGLKSIYSRVQILNGTINYYTDNEKKAGVIMKAPILS